MRLTIFSAGSDGPQGRAMRSGNVVPGPTLRRSVLGIVVIVGALAPTASNALPTELVPRWSAFYGYSASGETAQSKAVVVSPDGTRTYVTGVAPSWNYATVAYDAADGTELWVARYPDSGWGAVAIAVSPDGARVYVTGRTGYPYRMTSVAYDATTGTQLWVAHYDGPGDDYASSLAVSPDGSKVYVTGSATIAYDAATGSQLWVSPRDGRSGLAVSPDGARVYVSGQSTVALDAVGGSQIWIAPGTNDAYDGDFAMSSDGRSLYVVNPWYAATSQYDAADGSLKWSFRFNPWDGGVGNATVAVSPPGFPRRVYVTTGSYASTFTFALDGQGSLMWSAHGDSPWGSTQTLTAGKNGLVYMTASGGYGGSPCPGFCGVYVGQTHSALVVYDASGDEVSNTSFEAAWADVAISPDGSRLFATGRMNLESSEGAIRSYATVAFCTGEYQQFPPVDYVPLPGRPVPLPYVYVQAPQQGCLTGL